MDNIKEQLINKLKIFTDQISETAEFFLAQVTTPISKTSIGANYVTEFIKDLISLIKIEDNYPEENEIEETIKLIEKVNSNIHEIKSYIKEGIRENDISVVSN